MKNEELKHFQEFGKLIGDRMSACRYLYIEDKDKGERDIICAQMIVLSEIYAAYAEAYLKTAIDINKSE